jgi:hypothetical protein
MKYLMQYIALLSSCEKIQRMMRENMEKNTTVSLYIITTTLCRREAWTMDISGKTKLEKNRR